VKSNGNAPPWRPDQFARRAPFLKARGAILTALRAWFGQNGFVEVDTPALQISPGVEAHLRAFTTTLEEPFGLGARQMFLHTSPEYAMKKLLAAGVPRLFQIGHVWRNEARSPVHHPEFTMIEWYAVSEDQNVLMTQCADLVRAALAAVPHDLSRGCLTFGTQTADPTGPFERVTMAEAYARYAEIDLLATLGADGSPIPRALLAACRAGGIAAADGDTWEDMFFRIFVDRIEMHLGIDRPTLLVDWPAPLAALARIDPNDQRIAQRCELYVAGLELGNGFVELTDPAEQRRRFETDLATKVALGAPGYPIDDDLLAALEHGLPASVGMAVGFDRLVMLATGAETIADVLWLPVAEL
jgi:lysyl-tRNA synthetase class 2